MKNLLFCFDKENSSTDDNLTYRINSQKDWEIRTHTDKTIEIIDKYLDELQKELSYRHR